MTVDVNTNVRFHTNGGIQLDGDFGSLAGGEVEEEGISSNGPNRTPKWLRFTTFKELDYATLRSKSVDMLGSNVSIGGADTKLLEITTEPGLDRHLISCSMVFTVASNTYYVGRPRVFLTAIRSRIGTTDHPAAYQAICFSKLGEMNGCQMSSTIYTTVNTPGDRSPLNLQLMARVDNQDGVAINAMDGSLSILSWNDPD